MTLGFMQKFPKGTGSLEGLPTYFVEKILNSMHYDLKHGAVLNQFIEANKLVYKTKNELIDKIRVVKPKKHTMRKDEKDLWKAGNKIHFVINNRTKNRFQFAPVIPCVSTQKVEITYFQSFEYPVIQIDERYLNIKEYDLLAINDGFDSVEDFFKYFSEDWKGTLIHWTNLKY